MNRFSEIQIKNLEKRGIDPEKASEQLDRLNSPVRFCDIIEPAIPGNGIKKINEEDKADLMKIFHHAKADGRFTKFVPASGAATRMFNDLIVSKENGLNDAAKRTMENLRLFPFFNDLNNFFLFRNLDIESLINDGDWNEITDCILYEKGLNYANKPKALLKFTKYGEYSKTALEEQIYEAKTLISGEDRNLRVHFTFSENYISAARELIDSVREEMPSYTINADFSVQRPSTDTIAVYEDGTPVMEDSGELVLRPGGHGALIGNLSAINADLVLIKNIDNIVNSDHRSVSDEYNMLLCAYLLEIESKIKFFTENIETFTYDIIEQVSTFSQEYLFTEIEDNMGGMTLPEIKKYIYDYLNRPIRVCGMIKNTGEPGGGPFFVRNEKGISLQIVESSQIDLSDPEKRSVFESSTYFNPVNIVCSLRDHKGKNFDLTKFVDENTYFISNKTYRGKNIRALELPGLWNGAMADWITVFVEVPEQVFCPAKTINDLLRKERFPKDILEDI